MEDDSRGINNEFCIMHYEGLGLGRSHLDICKLQIET